MPTIIAHPPMRIMIPHPPETDSIAGRTLRLVLPAEPPCRTATTRGPSQCPADRGLALSPAHGPPVRLSVSNRSIAVPTPPLAIRAIRQTTGTPRAPMPPRAGRTTGSRSARASCASPIGDNRGRAAGVPRRGRPRGAPSSCGSRGDETGEPPPHRKSNTERCPRAAWQLPGTCSLAPTPR